jgi:hypothetical protein
VCSESRRNCVEVLDPKHIVCQEEMTSTIPKKPLRHVSVDTVGCEFCKKILRSFEAPPEEELIVIIGNVAEVLPEHGACPEHGPFLEAALEYSNKKLEEWGQAPNFKSRSEDTRQIIIKNFEGDNTAAFILLWGEDDEMHMGVEKKLVWKRGESNHPGDAMIVDENWMDMNLVERWKTECEKHHDKCRLKRGLQGGVRPLLLIDVKDRCIVSSEHAPGDFVALSYCWGVPETGKPYWFRNEKAISADLQKPGSLSPEGKFGPLLPGTIRDTIEMTERLGERYVWIDSLCIVQDDYDMKNIELPKMSEIYATACLTLIAAQGPHADSGLPGFNFTGPRRVSQSIAPIGTEKLADPIEILHGMATTYEQAAYHTRGWTFQEYQFGRRRLIFEQQSMRWECRDASWVEDLRDAAPMADLGKQWDTDGISNPGIIDLNIVINGYNTRQLGYNSDAFPAFCGFQRILSKSYEQGFINGMPIKFFDVAMAWIPGMDDVRRKKTDKNDLDPPSWSWLGWSGEVDITFSGDAEVLEDQTSASLYVNKLVDWYSMTTLKAPKKPLRESSQDGSPSFNVALEPLFLYCRTHSTTFASAGPLHDKEIDRELCGPWFQVRNHSGRWCGVLRLHAVEDVADLNEEMELVAISRGHCPDKKPDHALYGLTEWHALERPKRGLDYHYYNVLWVVRDGEVAYRKAIGRISKEAWEDSDIKPTDLILR